MNNRKPWIDSARGIAFLMVIYSHIDYCNPSLMRYFKPIFLTTFFFVSGYLFKRSASFVAIIDQRIRTLILPFLIYGMINIVASHLIAFNQSTHTSFAGDVMGFAIQIRGRNDGLWFIACLFTTSIFFVPLAKYLRDTKALLFVSGLLFVINRVIDLSPIPWHFQSVGYVMFYMSLGVYYKENEDRLGWISSRISIILFAAIYALGVTFYWIATKKMINFGSTKWVIDEWVIAVSGLILCVSISRNIPNARFLQFIGANSLLYFALHGKGYAVLQVIAEKILKQMNISHGISLDFMLGLSIVALDAVLLVIPVMIINRYAPFTLGKGFSFYKYRQSDQSSLKSNSSNSSVSS